MRISRFERLCSQLNLRPIEKVHSEDPVMLAEGFLTARELNQKALKLFNGELHTKGQWVVMWGVQWGENMEVAQPMTFNFDVSRDDRRKAARQEALNVAATLRANARNQVAEAARH